MCKIVFIFLLLRFVSFVHTYPVLHFRPAAHYKKIQYGGNIRLKAWVTSAVYMKGWAKRDRGSLSPSQQLHKNINEMFKITVPKIKLGNDEHISPHTVQNIKQRIWRNFNVQREKLKLKTCDLRNPRQYYWSIHTDKRLFWDYVVLLNTTKLIFCKMVVLMSLDLKAHVMDNHTVEKVLVVFFIVYCGVFWEEWTPYASHQRQKGPSSLWSKSSVLVWSWNCALSKPHLHFSDSSIYAEK